MEEEVKKMLQVRLENISSEFVECMEEMGHIIHTNAFAHGWWEEGTDRNFGEQIMLMVTELAEALEAYRNEITFSDHVPTMDAIAEEFADTVIRIMDTCWKYEYDLAGTIIEKMKYNLGRDYKHGGKKI